MNRAPVRVVVADDSPFARRAFARVISSAADLELVGEAGDGQEALELCGRIQPDVLLLDLEMPGVDGQQVLRALREEHSAVRAVVVSAATQAGAPSTLRALEAGAVDFVDKAAVSRMQIHVLGDELVAKIRAAARQAPARTPFVARPPIRLEPPRVLVVAASTGGPAALGVVLAALPEDFAAPVVVVQHMPAAFLRELTANLAAKCALPVRQSGAAALLAPGEIVVASAGADLRIDASRDGALRCAQRPPSEGAIHVPSADTLFHSAAATVGAAAWGVLLTGMGRDGAEGLLAIRRAGGLTLAQDEASSAVWGMPRAAVELDAVAAVLPLAGIAGYLRAATRAAAQPGEAMQDA